MAHVLADRVKETSTTTGTGTYDLAGAETGFQGFVAGVGDGNTTFYFAEDGTDWEVGIGTVTDAATDTLARTTILASSNSGSAVNWGAGTKNIGCGLPASGAGAPNVQEFSSSGTWNKPTCTFVLVELWGAGGGGGSGRQGAAASRRFGGGGGAGGAYTERRFKASDLSATVSVTIGAGGSGAAAQTSADTNGSDGTAGGDSSFGTLLYAYGGAGGNSGKNIKVAPSFGGGALANGSGDGHPLAGQINNTIQGGGFGTGFNGTSGGALDGAPSGWGGGAGGGTDSGTTAAGEGGCSFQGGSGGGQGGCIESSDTLIDAGDGGSITGAAGGGGAGGASHTTTPVAGTAGTTFRYGGGGGGAADSAAAAAGGDGGIAAGGGGGGGSVNGNNSGAGGDGGDGFCRVYSW